MRRTWHQPNAHRSIPIGLNDCPVLPFLIIIQFGLSTAEPGTADLHDIIQ